MNYMNETKMKIADMGTTGEWTQKNILTCEGAGCRQAFILGRVEIGHGVTDEEAMQNLLCKLQAWEAGL